MPKFLSKEKQQYVPEDINWEEEVQYDPGNHLNDDSLSDDVIFMWRRKK